MPDAMHEADHWRALASRATTAAAQMSDLDARMNMLRIAVGYEQLAREAEQRQSNAPETQTDDRPSQKLQIRLTLEPGLRWANLADTE